MLIHSLSKHTAAPRLSGLTQAPPPSLPAKPRSKPAPADAYLAGQTQGAEKPEPGPEIGGLKKAVLVATLGITAVGGMASTAGAAPLAAAQAVSAELQNQDPAGMKVLVVPHDAPRLDVIRQTHPGFNDYEDEIKVDYSPVGVHLGGGLFHDAKGNLTVVPFLSYDWDLAVEDFQRIDIGGDDKLVQRFGNTVHFNESSSKRHVFTERDGSVEMLSTEGRTTFNHKEDGSIQVKGPDGLDYTVVPLGNNFRVLQSGERDVMIVKSGGEMRVNHGDALTGAVSLENGAMKIVSGDGRATVTRSDNGLITEIDGSRGWRDARIVRDGDLILGRKDKHRLEVDDDVSLVQDQERFQQVLAHLEAVEPGFAEKHPVVVSVLRYAASNPDLLTEDGTTPGWLQAGSTLGTAGGALQSGIALTTGATALSLASSARALGAAALSARAAAEAAAAAGNLTQAGALANEAQQLAGRAHQIGDQAMEAGKAAKNSAKVARVMLGVAGALEIVDGGLGLHSGGSDRSLVEGAVAVTQARFDELAQHLEGQEREKAMEDYSRIMGVLDQLSSQADKKIRVGGLKIGFGALLVASALLGPEAPPIVAMIGIAGTAGTTIYEHWDPIRDFVTGDTTEVPSFLDIFPETDEVIIHLDGKGH